MRTIVFMLTLLLLSFQCWAQPAVEETADNLVAMFPCASAKWSEDNPHHFSLGLERPGRWQEVFDTYITEAVEDLGYERIMFHLPRGKNTGQSEYETRKRELEAQLGKSYAEWSPVEQEQLAGLTKTHMSLDPEAELRRTGFDWVSTEFFSALDEFHSRHPNVEFIVYEGSWDGEDTYESEMGSYGEVLHDAIESLQPLLDRDWISIVFDAAVSMPEDHPNSRLAQLTKWHKDQKGRFTGVEARFQEANRWSLDQGYIAVMWGYMWYRNYAPGVVTYDQYTQPSIIVWDGGSRSLVDSRWNGDWWAAAADTLKVGNTPAVSTLWGDMAGMHAEEVSRRLHNIAWPQPDPEPDPQPRPGINMYHVNAGGAVDGFLPPANNVLGFWINMPGPIDLTDEAKRKLEDDMALFLVDWLNN